MLTIESFVTSAYMQEWSKFLHPCCRILSLFKHGETITLLTLEIPLFSTSLALHTLQAP